MKVKKKPMPTWQKIFYVCSFVFLIWAFIYLGTKNYNAPIKKLTDQESFTQEYGITSKNIYVYKNAKEILETINSGSAVIFLGFPENKWSSSYAEILNDVAKDYGLKEIYYYNFLKDRSNNNTYYEKIVNQLTSYLSVLDNETINIYAPAMLIVKDGEILIYDDETSIIKGDISVGDYWTFSAIQNKKEQLSRFLELYLEVPDEEY